MNQFNPISSPIEPGLTLLEAGAGTGKTYSLVRIIARELVEKQIPVDQVLTVTFTRAATAEIKCRLQELLTEILLHLKHPPGTDACNDLALEWLSRGDAFVQQAIATISLAVAKFDSFSVFTIDGFFQRLLKECAFESQVLFTTELEQDERSIASEALRDYWRQHVYGMDAVELGTFNRIVSFEDAKGFVSKMLQASIECPGAFYKTDAKQQLKRYQKPWEHFCVLLKKHRVALEEFVLNVIPGLSKSHPPFKKGTPEPFLNEVDRILANPAIPDVHLAQCRHIAGARLFSVDAFNKNKYQDLSTHPLAELFQAVDDLLDVRPEFIQSAYLGKIYTYVRQRMSELKLARNVQSFNDVTNTLKDLLSTDNPVADALKSTVQSNYRAVLIDEFQDTSPQQCQVFLKLFHHGETYFHIIGDPKQSIYKFRGADVYSYIKAKEQRDHEYSLATNYRSTPRMIHAVNQLYSMADDPFLTDEKITFTPANWPGQTGQARPDDGPPALHFHYLDPGFSNKDNFNEAIQHNICTEILKLLDTPWSTVTNSKDYRGDIEPQDIAILVNSSSEGMALIERLSKLGIPAATTTRTSLLDSGEAGEVHAILSAILEPHRSDLARGALLCDALGGGIHISDETKINNFINDLADLGKIWEDWGLIPMFQELMKRWDIKQTLLGLSLGKRRLTNFQHLAELLDRKARAKRLAPEATLQWLGAAIQGETTDTESDELELRLSEDAGCVQILTQHSSKGLEFPITFVTPPCPRHYHHLSPIQPALDYHDPETLDIIVAPNEEYTSAEGQRLKEACADRARLAYVALTRSKALCHFYYVPPTLKNEEHAVYRMLGAPELSTLESMTAGSSSCILFNFISHEQEPEALPFYQPKDKATQTSLQVRSGESINITFNQRTTSFTGITRHEHDHFTGNADYDAHTNASPQAVESGFWKKLQAGASLGTAFHEILEDIDFQDPSSIRPVVQRKLSTYAPWSETPDSAQFKKLVDEVSKYVQQLLSHPLTDTVTLDQLPANKRLTEPAFLLKGSNFTLSSLCDILESDPSVKLPTGYLDSLRHLPKSQFEGFLTGFIDLVFEHDGRYHIIDWKSNRLPELNSDGMAQVMAEHHYFLQYHLYALALDRLLSLRLGDAYDSDKHLGDVFYVFLRAVDPEVPGSGVFHDRIQSERLAALRAAFQAETIAI